MPRININREIEDIRDRISRSPYSRRLVYSDQYGTFILKPTTRRGSITKLSGLTKKLKNVFWPDYEYVRNKYSTGTGAKNSFDGLERGKLVHRQIRDYFNLSDTEFVNRYKAHGDTKTNGKEEIHEYTDKFVRALRTWGIVPISSEIPVMFLPLKLATAVDTLCISKKTGKLILFEIKNGFDHYMLKGNGKMHGPRELAKYSNSPLNQAHLQTAFTKFMFESTYNINIDKAYTINITQDGVLTFPLEEKISDSIEDCLKYMANAKKETSKKVKKKTTRNISSKAPKVIYLD